MDSFDAAADDAKREAARQARRESMLRAHVPLRLKQAERRRFKQLRQLLEIEQQEREHAGDYIDEKSRKSRHELRVEMLELIEWRCEECGKAELNPRRWHFFRKRHFPVCLRCWAKRRNKRLGRPESKRALPHNMVCPCCNKKKTNRKAWYVNRGICRVCGDRDPAPYIGKPRKEPVNNISLLTDELWANMRRVDAFDRDNVMAWQDMRTQDAQLLLESMVRLGMIARVRYRSKRFRAVLTYQWRRDGQ